MRALTALAAALLLCGCIETPWTTPTTTTDPHFQTTSTVPAKANASLEEAYSRAADRLAGMPAYSAGACGRIVIKNATPDGCQACWNLTLSYDCATNMSKTARTLREHFVRVGQNETEVTALPEKTLCTIDGDCMGAGAKSGIRFACEGGLCVIKKFEGEASNFCIDTGNRLEMRVLPSGGAYNMCIFKNGNECEEEAYLNGWCNNESGNITTCAMQGSVGLCTTGYVPVCARVRPTANLEASEWMQFSNPCLACNAGDRKLYIEGYFMGYCTTTTTQPRTGIFNVEAEFCKKNGYVYRIKKYPSGREYAVCLFDLEDECDAIDYFHGKCGPKGAI
jgi:putative hemolysin